MPYMSVKVYYSVVVLILFFRSIFVLTASEKLLSVWREMELTALNRGQVRRRYEEDTKRECLV